MRGGAIIMDEYNLLCKKDDARKANEQLKEMHDIWIKECASELCENVPWTNPTLLNCSDSYFESKRRIIIYGQESNERSDNEKERSDNGEKNWAGYTYINQTADKIISNKFNGPPFLKFRMKFTSIKECFRYTAEDRSEIIKIVSEVPINNLNKVSINGHLTPINCVKSLFGKFHYNLENKTVFQHELDIVKPDIIILACGPNYKDHFKTAFNINEDLEPLSKRNLYTSFNICSTKAIWTYHPSYLARINKLDEVIENIQKLIQHEVKY